MRQHSLLGTKSWCQYAQRAFARLSSCRALRLGRLRRKSSRVVCSIELRSQSLDPSSFNVQGGLVAKLSSSASKHPHQHHVINELSAEGLKTSLIDFFYWKESE
jgi:hypothetical protein